MCALLEPSHFSCCQQVLLMCLLCLSNLNEISVSSGPVGSDLPSWKHVRNLGIRSGNCSAVFPEQK